VFWVDLAPNKSAAQKAEGEAICSTPAQLEETEDGRLIRLASGPAAALAEKEHKQADDGSGKDGAGQTAASGLVEACLYDAFIVEGEQIGH
jgi:hypothetical protein